MEYHSFSTSLLVLSCLLGDANRAREREELEVILAFDEWKKARIVNVLYELVGFVLGYGNNSIESEEREKTREAK